MPNRAAVALRDPWRSAAAVIRRAFPNSRIGVTWIHLPDGSITFEEDGFVAASSPSALLARHNFEVRRIREELSGLVADRSLEIGCGFGRLSPTITDFSRDHVAVDINARALQQARRDYPGPTYWQAEAQRLPFADRTFDLVISWTVLQHIRPGMIEPAAAEIVRMLSPGATLLICEETYDPKWSGGHSWHRTVATYQELLQPLELLRHGYIVEIDRLRGERSPGEVMVFRMPALETRHESMTSAS
jgi:SAM-dependent methyltransferase